MSTMPSGSSTSSMSAFQGAISQAVREHWKLFLVEGIILVILGILAIIAGILYVAGAANSIHFMVGSVHKGHHLARAAVSFVVGIALLIIAWFAARTHR